MKNNKLTWKAPQNKRATNKPAGGKKQTGKLNKIGARDRVGS